MVSIHVPARGTTQRKEGGEYDKTGFNPRSRTGNDDDNTVLLRIFFQFQSTFPHGERQGSPPYTVFEL